MLTSPPTLWYQEHAHLLPHATFFRGMAWPPQPTQHTGPVRSPSSTLCSSTPNSATWMHPFSQHHKLHCLNELHGSEGSGESSQRQLSLTFHTCDQLTLMQTCHSLHASHPCCKGSTAVSSALWVNESGTPNFPSPEMSWSVSSMQQYTPQWWGSSTSRHP